MISVLFAGGGTGGHLYPALNLGAAMSAEDPAVEPHYVGARRGVEARVLPERKVPHTLLPLEPIRRDRVWQNWRLGPSLAGSVARLARLVLRLRPRLVVGTGGYASGPACFWAVATGIPLALQEQNSYPGLTTRWLSRWARQLHLGFPEAERHLKAGRRTEVFALGNPIAPPALDLDRGASRRGFGLDPHGTVALVVGGSQGALPINEALTAALRGVADGSLPMRPEGLELLWATGPAHIESVRAAVDPLGFDWVHPVGYIDEMQRALAAADLAISRAGAMQTAELQAWGIASILVPLPTAAADHQRHNAQALEDAGAAVSMPQTELTAGHLWSELRGLAVDVDRRRSMGETARDRSRPDAAREIARHLLRLVRR